jgi:FtsP/CotA-like multicopper oxidase with cupredoxin domain
VIAGELSTHDHEHMHDMTSDYSGMGGMVLGITVTGNSVIDTVNNWNPTHKIEMSVGTQKGEAGAYEISLKDADMAKPAVSKGLTGPVLVVTQGEKTEIAITNTMKEPTSIHWHGMEVESYYDGVPWWGGIDEKRAPAVEPGQTFTVRMIPPRAGTFMYHTHWHDAAQLTGGIHGAMIVLAPGQKYDPNTDISFLFSISPAQPYGAGLLLLNGSPQPAALRLKTGRTYRFRFINITPATDNLEVSLRDENGLAAWRELAKDACDVKTEGPQKAEQRVAIGETFDFEYRAEKAGEVTLQGWPMGNARRVIQTLIFGE